MAQDHASSRLADAAGRFFKRAPSALDPSETRVLETALARELISQDVNEQFSEDLSLGDRMADAVARFGGSWGFIGAFGVFLTAWAGLNIWMAGQAFDPYPFIFLNLMLSMLAAIQAPVIMMSQNRHAQKDRLAAAHDYEINMKAEIEIMGLHDKLDQLRSDKIEAMIERQQAHIERLTAMLEAAGAAPPAPEPTGGGKPGPEGA